MSVRKSVLFGVALGVAVLGAGSAIASARPGHADAPTWGDTSGAATFLVADLNGKNEVTDDGKPNVGDQDGRAHQIVKIQGNEVSFAISWRGIAAPTAAHIHEGVAGKNGPVKVPFFALPPTKTLPGTLNAVTGRVTVNDTAFLDSLKKNPGNFYANVHNSEFPAGAVRAQFRKVRHANLNDVLNERQGSLFASATGSQEVPGSQPVGDKDGFAIFSLKPSHDHIKFSIRWSNTSAPTAAHVHKGGIGVNGPIVVGFFDASPDGLPASLTAVAGSATAPAAVINKIKEDPIGHYGNLHTTEFTGGAVRGQFFRIG